MWPGQYPNNTGH